ncbi:MAG: hypothetical protein AVDCRST_MAG61-854, partial [uncultured Friedmanniella sp.]
STPSGCRKLWTARCGTRPTRGRPTCPTCGSPVRPASSAGFDAPSGSASARTAGQPASWATGSRVRPA